MLLVRKRSWMVAASKRSLARLKRGRPGGAGRRRQAESSRRPEAERDVGAVGFRDVLHFAAGAAVRAGASGDREVSRLSRREVADELDGQLALVEPVGGVAVVDRGQLDKRAHTAVGADLLAANEELPVEHVLVPHRVGSGLGWGR